MDASIISNANKKDLLRQIDAVCDEILKAFEQADINKEGVLDVLGYRRFIAILSGGNIVRLKDRKRQCHKSQKEFLLAKLWTDHRRSAKAPLNNVIDTFNNKLKDRKFYDQCIAGRAMQFRLSPPLDHLSYRLLEVKKQRLCNTPLDEIDKANQGFVDAQNILDYLALGAAFHFPTTNLVQELGAGLLADEVKESVTPQSRDIDKS